MRPNNPIYPLHILGKEASGKNKKRKIDLGKSIGDETNSCRPSKLGIFQDILVEIKAIKELVVGFPQGLRESSTT